MKTDFGSAKRVWFEIIHKVIAEVPAELAINVIGHIDTQTSRIYQPIVDEILWNRFAT